jgi:transaldolase
MKSNPLNRLREFGQSIWLDFLSRKIMRSGELKKLIEEDGVQGMTSNPSIFNKSITGGEHYDEDIKEMTGKGKEPSEIYEAIAVKDVQDAADMFRPVYDRLDGRDGFVSLEVNPHLARDIDGTIEEARRLWKKVNRPNIFIKVPATLEGLPCIRQLIREGININVTLLFGLNRYWEVAQAYISGIEDRLKDGKPVEGISSVASFFLSRIDVLIDPMLKEIIENRGKKRAYAEKSYGQVAISSAKEAYQIYREIFHGNEFGALKGKGASVQRVLWASTSTKNPDFSDVKYVEPLIGPETVNTVPRETLDAYRDHGNPDLRLEKGLEDARLILSLLPELGIDMYKISQQLEDEGIEKFNRPYDDLIASIEKKRSASGRDRED